MKLVGSEACKKVKFQDLPIGSVVKFGCDYFMKTNPARKVGWTDNSPMNAIWMTGVYSGALCKISDCRELDLIDAKLMVDR